MSVPDPTLYLCQHLYQAIFPSPISFSSRLFRCQYCPDSNTSGPRERTKVKDELQSCKNKKNKNKTSCCLLYWQRANEELNFLIYYANQYSFEQLDLVKGRFWAESPLNSSFTLEIKTPEAEDSALYFCSTLPTVLKCEFPQLRIMVFKKWRCVFTLFLLLT